MDFVTSPCHAIFVIFYFFQYHFFITVVLSYSINVRSGAFYGGLQNTIFQKIYCWLFVACYILYDIFETENVMLQVWEYLIFIY